MNQHFIYKNCFNHRYSFCRKSNANIAPHHRLTFSDLYAAKKFVLHLKLDDSQLRRLAKKLHLPTTDPLNVISTSLYKTSLWAIPLTNELQARENKRNGKISSAANASYQFTPANEAPPSASRSMKFSSRRQAENFISSLNVSDEQKSKLAAMVQTGKSEKASSVNKIIAEALVSKTLLVFKPSSKSTNDGNQESEMDTAATQPGNIPVPPPPKAETQPKPAEESKSTSSNTQLDQATTAELAAESGAPFCEECEEEAA